MTITKPLPEISIGNRVFKAESQLGEGGLGNVYLYVNKSDHNYRIAFNICKPDAVGRDRVMGRADTISEVLAHDASQAGGSVNILKLEGAVRLASSAEKIQHYKGSFRPHVGHSLACSPGRRPDISPTH